jgi:hypothetical protein
MDDIQFKRLLDKIEELLVVEKKNNTLLEDVLNLFKQYDGEVILGDEEFRDLPEG